MEPDPLSVTANDRLEMSRDAIVTLIAAARQRLNEGNPALALRAVVTALRALGGERAVSEAFIRAREVHHSARQTNSAVDDLTALFADCGITDIQSINFGTNGGQHVASGQAVANPSAIGSETQDMDVLYENVPIHENSAPILAESGRLQVVTDAASDGSSFICENCGGVVSVLRKDEHFEFWCSRVTR